MSYEETVAKEFIDMMVNHNIAYKDVKAWGSKPTFDKILKGLPVKNASIESFKTGFIEVLKQRQAAKLCLTKNKEQQQPVPEETTETEEIVSLAPPVVSARMEMLQKISTNIDSLRKLVDSPQQQQATTFAASIPALENRYLNVLTVFKEVLANKEPVLVIVDGANFYAQMRAAYEDSPIPYQSIRNFFHKNGNLLRINYYIASVIDNDYISSKKISDYLAHNGYNIVTREVAKRVNADGVYTHKSNMDVEIAVDLAMVPFIMPQVKHVVLVSGDSDFLYPLNVLKSRGIRTTVISNMEATAAYRSTPDLYVPLYAFIKDLGT